MFTKILYGIAAVCLTVSFYRDRKKTRMALKKAWKSFENILPFILAILLLMGLILSVLDERTVSRPVSYTHLDVYKRQLVYLTI